MKYIYIYAFFSGMIFDRTLWILFLKDRSFSLTIIGIFQTFLNLTMAILEIPSGYISDKIGPKKTLIIAHFFIIFYLLCMIIPLREVSKIVAFIFYGIGLSLASGSEQSLIYKELLIKKEESKYQKVIGMYNSIFLFSLTLAIFLGGFIQKKSWNYIYIATIVFQIISILFLLYFKKNSSVVVEKEKIDFYKSLKNLKKFLFLEKNYRYLILIIAISQGTISVLYMQAQVLFEEIGLNNQEISIVFTIISILTIFILAKSYLLSEKFSKKTVVFYTLIILLFAFILIGLKHKIIIILAIVIMHSIFAILDNNLNSILHGEILDEYRTTLVSIANAFVQTVMFTLFPIISFLGDIFPMKYLICLTGIIAIILCIILNCSFNKNNLKGGD
ncbi:MAG: MFS transporter [Fusobacterium sp.]|nr:MFS transporter [Fusobacterium sp.]